MWIFEGVDSEARDTVESGRGGVVRSDKENAGFAGENSGGGDVERGGNSGRDGRGIGVGGCGDGG